MGRTRIAVLVALVVVPRLAIAQGNPLGTEFRVNTYTTGNQDTASVALGGSNFVVVWQSEDQDASTSGIYAQRYATSGIPLGPEFRVNTITSVGEDRPVVAADASGNFVVVWQSLHDGSYWGIFGQRFATSGAPLGPEFQINTYITGYQYRPSVASGASGNLVVVWASQDQDGSNAGIFGRRYAANGTPLGTEFRVNTVTTGFQEDPAVACDSAGNFVVVWMGAAASGIFGQRYASNGTPLGSEFRVNTYIPPFQLRPSVAAAGTGDFVVAWDSPQDGDGAAIVAQRYASSGAPAGPEFRVNTYTTFYQFNAVAGADSAGNFVIAWQSFQDGASYGVFGQRYASDGAPLGGEFRVNTSTTSLEGDPAVGVDSAGNFEVVWQSFVQDGSALGVFGQRFSQILPVELTHITVE